MVIRMLECGRGIIGGQRVTSTCRRNSGRSNRTCVCVVVDRRRRDAHVLVELLPVNHRLGDCPADGGTCYVDHFRNDLGGGNSTFTMMVYYF